MQLTLKDNLPFARLKVAYQGEEIEIADVLVDTGSATTILAADRVAQINIVPEPADVLFTIRGVGGIEAVFARRIVALSCWPAPWTTPPTAPSTTGRAYSTRQRRRG